MKGHIRKKIHDFVEATRAANSKPQSTTAMLTECWICNNYPPREQRATQMAEAIAPSAVNSGMIAPSAVQQNRVVYTQKAESEIYTLKKDKVNPTLPRYGFEKPASKPVAEEQKPELVLHLQKVRP